MEHDAQLVIRVPSELKTRLAEAAARVGHRPTDYARRLLVAALEREARER